MSRKLLNLTISIFIIGLIHSIKAAEHPLSIYKNALSYIDSKEYKKADSLLAIYIKKFNNPITYLSQSLFNTLPNEMYQYQAFVKLELKDTCAFCKSISMAGLFDDENQLSMKAYYEICATQIDSLFLDKNLNKVTKDNSKYILITFYDKFKKKRLGQIDQTKYKFKSQDPLIIPNMNKAIARFHIVEQDTIFDIFNNHVRPHLKITYDDILNEISYPENKKFAKNFYQKDNLVVNLLILIDEKGNTISSKVESVDPVDLDDKYKIAALNTLSKIKKSFKPFVIGNKSVKAEILLPIIYDVSKDD